MSVIDDDSARKQVLALMEKELASTPPVLGSGVHVETPLPHVVGFVEAGPRHFPTSYTIERTRTIPSVASGGSASAEREMRIANPEEINSLNLIRDSLRNFGQRVKPNLPPKGRSRHYKKPKRRK